MTPPRQCAGRAVPAPGLRRRLCRYTGVLRRHRLRRPHGRRADDGTTLVELLVSSILLTVVLATVVLAVNGMTRTAGRLEAAAVAGDEARAVTDALTRGLGNATAVNAPVSVGGTVYLEALSPAPGAAGEQRCRQWRVQPVTGLVQTRGWTAGASDVSAWTTIGRGAVDVSAHPPFAVLPADGDWVHARVVVDVRLRHAGGPVVTASSVVSLVNGVGDGGGLAADRVCPEAGRP